MKELSKTYEPHDVEDKWIKVWLDKNLFAPKVSSSAQSFSMVIPPPNVTGSLHMGHALNNTVQDILVRYHRMKGDNTLWVVGTDHAGIATQNVVERQLKEEGKTRDDLGREKFIERVWKWKEKSGGTIVNQLKRLGASCDFANERFTMDEGLSAAVKKVFVQLYNEKLIYRGYRLINWCPRCHTALSDLEVEHETKKGKLWHIKYPMGSNSPQPSLMLGGGEKFLIVATTRPETLFGDVAVAVNPDDERYQSLVGTKVKLPLTDREIPVIADSYVSQDFGSGVVKITPAHDFNDYAVGERHHLDRINIFNESAQLNEHVPEAYCGLDRFKARDKVVEDLKAQELLVQEEDYQNSVGHCYRCRTVVEPYLSNQWFVKASILAKPAIEAVKTKKTQFVPEHWEKTYFNWMENIQDWCVSRQIWWGHQIPAWYCGDKNCSPIVSEISPKECPTCHSTKLTQETDVLDTWFSSALWPFSTLGWPDQTEKLKTFYPTSTLVTAFDIIFFWVARMMMMGLHFMKEVPFKTVHIHALVRDPLGQKMSKSKGNVIDPLILMEKYGTDAFRFTLAAFAAQGRDIKLDEARVEGYRNFCNKIWNATRFAMMNAAPFINDERDFASVNPTLDDLNKWILYRLNFVVQEAAQKIEAYEFNMAAHALYKFFWNEFCDAYVEYTKEIYKSDHEALKKETAQTTYYVLDTAMRLLHPFMPFITEEIWQVLAERVLADGTQKSIVVQGYPLPQDLASYHKAALGIDLVSELLAAIRSTRQELGISLTEEISIEVRLEKSSFDMIDSFSSRLSRLAKVKAVFSGDVTLSQISKPSVLTRTQSGWVIFPHLDAARLDKAKDLQQKRLKKTEGEIMGLEKQVADPNFPLDLKKEKQTLLKELQMRKTDIQTAINYLT